MAEAEVHIVGAGVGGLATAARLATHGRTVTVYETASHLGGKIRSCRDAANALDVGPTVVTLLPVFEALFQEAGKTKEDYLTAAPLDVLAHHRWRDGSQLNLYQDLEKTLAALESFSGAQAAAEFQAFSQQAQQVYGLLANTFLTAPQQGLPGLLRRTGAWGLPKLTSLSPFQSFWRFLAKQFSDPRLRQLFARYATYCGSSPFAAPSTLMLIAHVEALGVWRIQGGMRGLAAGLSQFAEDLGVRFVRDTRVSAINTHHGQVSHLTLADGDEVTANTVVFCGDTNALASGMLGNDTKSAVRGTPAQKRSLSAITWAGRCELDADNLELHNVFFSDDYPKEFDDIFKRSHPPKQPTLYAFLPDADNDTTSQRLFLLMNAPPTGDSHDFQQETQRHTAAAEAQLASCGIPVKLNELEITTPTDFNQAYPGTGGALYGPAMHGWQAAFQRPGSKTSVRGLYLAGGSVHPGSGVPMATLSGLLAANQILELPDSSLAQYLS